MAGHSLPPLKALRVFEAAARLRSFTAAADELSITHSAVSQQIRILEDHVGQPLFAREARGVALLPCAQAYFPEVQASLERIAAATAKLRAPGFTGTLRVCATPSLTMKWLIPRLSCFQALHPGIDVQLTTQGRSFLDRGGDAGSDVLLRHGYMAHAELSCVHCLDDFHVPVASPRFIELNRLAAPADCLGHPLLKVAGAWTTGRAGSRWPRSTCPRNCPPVFDHHFLCMQAAMNDLGIALAPWCLLQDDIAADRLRPLFAQPQLPNAGIHALYRPDGPAAAAAQRFIDWLCGQGTEPSRGA